MRPPPLQIHKLKQAIKSHGVTYEFKRPPVDDFGDAIPDAELVVEATAGGIFSESGTGFIMIIGEAATVHSKPSPAIATLLEDAEGIKIEDLVRANNATYKVTAVNDLGNLGYFAGISLEVILDGSEV